MTIMTMTTDVSLLGIVVATAAAALGAVRDVDAFSPVVTEAEAERGEEITTGVETVKQVVVTRNVADGVHRVTEAAEHEAGEHNAQ